MKFEIERKYLVDRTRWMANTYPEDASFMQQAYLSRDPARSIRVRVTENRAWITIKGKAKGIKRPEYEYQIPVKDAEELMDLAVSSVVIKRRYRHRIKGYLWEVDEFLGENEGLILAEIELKDESETPALPEWIIREVTGDPKYYNMNLAVHPFQTW